MFEGSPDIPTLLAAAREKRDSHASLRRHIASTADTLNRRVGETVGADLRFLLPATLLLLGVRAYLIGAQRGTPGWYSLLWFGFSSSVMLNASQGPAGEVAAQAVQAAEPA